MSIKIKKQTGEIFDLPSDYTIEVEKNNPLFTKKGSKTVPIHFPNTSNNRKLLLHTDRIDKLERIDPIPVVVESGASQQAGLMAVNSGFNAGIGFDESEMYNKMSNMKLKDIPNLPVVTLSSGSRDDKITALLTHLTSVMKEEIDTDYFISPVVLSQETTSEGGTINDDILNEVVYNSREIAELAAWEDRQISKIISGETVLINIPKGYGVSPFLKVWRILELIFAHFGFQIEENPFKTHRQLKKLYVFNNTIDAILTGSLYYKDLMPDATVIEFFDSLYSIFGMKYYPNSNTKSVKIKFVKDIISPRKSGSIDLSSQKSEKPQIIYSSSKQIKIELNRQVPGTETLADTFENFLERYDFEFADSNSNVSNTTNNFRESQLTFVIQSILQNKTLISSDFFDYDKKSEMDYEEIKRTDLCLPFVRYQEARVLFYNVGRKNVYTDLIIDSSKQGDDGNTAELAFAFGWGITEGSLRYFFSSQANRDENGYFLYDENEERYDISLYATREDGTFNRFWKEYDAFLRHSNFEVKCKLNLNEFDISKIQMYETIFIDNQPLILKQIKYKMNNRQSDVECTFATLRLYQPYDLEKEQEIPTYHPQKYYWKKTQVDVPTRDELIELGYDYFYGYINGDYEHIYIYNPETDEEEKYGLAQLFIYPPTEEQFNQQVELKYEYSWYVYGAYTIPAKRNGKSYVTYRPALRE